MAAQGDAVMVKQNFTEECEAAINKQINMELYASYVYMSLVSSYSMLLFFDIYKKLALYMFIMKQ